MITSVLDFLTFVPAPVAYDDSTPWSAAKYHFAVSCRTVLVWSLQRRHGRPLTLRDLWKGLVAYRRCAVCSHPSHGVMEHEGMPGYHPCCAEALKVHAQARLRSERQRSQQRAALQQFTQQLFQKPPA